MARKKNSEQWISLVERWLGSEMRKSDFCKEQSVNIHTFNYWVKKYRQNSSFVEVKPEKTEFCNPEQFVRFSFLGGVSAEVPAELALEFMHQISSK